jgi:hypothetical protein
MTRPAEQNLLACGSTYQWTEEPEPQSNDGEGGEPLRYLAHCWKRDPFEQKEQIPGRCNSEPALG